MDRLSAEIKALEAEYLRFWEEVCNTESPTRYKAGVDAVAALFARRAEALGFACEWHREQVSGDVLCITMNSDVKASPFTMSGHLDTVHTVGSFGTPAVRIEGDRIYGPGVCDCKGGAVAALMAMEALARIGFRGRPVMLLLQSDEEMGSRFSDKRTIGYVCEKAKDSVAFFNMEGHTAGEACVQRKGIVTYRFEISGVEAHSSACATKGANAIAQAAHLILELEKIKDEAGLTCNCSVIEGGTVVNTVPGKCVFYTNVRFADASQLEWMERFVRELAEREYVAGCSTTVQRSGFRLAMERKERNLKLLERCNGIWKQAGLCELSPSMRKGGSDAADTTDFGIPTLDSLGVEGGSIHSVHEYAEIPSLAESARRAAVVAMKI